MTTRPVVVLLFQPHPPYLYAALQEGRVNPFEAVAANRTCGVRLAIFLSPGTKPQIGIGVAQLAVQRLCSVDE